MSKASDDDILAFLSGLLLGGLGGCLLGVLYAPKPGEKTRTEVNVFAKNLAERVNEGFNSSNTRTRGFIEKTRYNIENQVGKVRKDRAAGRMAKAKQAEARQSEEVTSGYDF